MPLPKGHYCWICDEPASVDQDYYHPSKGHTPMSDTETTTTTTTETPAPAPPDDTDDNTDDDDE